MGFSDIRQWPSASCECAAAVVLAGAFADRLREACRRARGYLLGRQSPAGGFCFYRSPHLDEPNLYDTWHAVSALALLGRRPPNEDSLASFVCDFPFVGQPYALYYRVFILDAIGHPEPDGDAVREAAHDLPLPSPPDPAADLTSQLEFLLLVLRVKAHFGLPFDAAGLASALRSLEHPDGGFGLPPNLIDTRQALDILALCGAAPTSRTAGFVERQAMPYSAFRLTDDAFSPNLETLCAGLACCRILRLPVRYATEAATFIFGCQTGRGGFARAPNALADIGMTHLALQGLTILFGPLSFDQVAEGEATNGENDG